ncbi:serine/threonine-protein kinase [Thalassoroseus pseudoceratinae]|uniref:serine/threonine-protein kinase n=1 Tax=Thalassoroseus pseudoceratinae TaxID=2713176 RepID=UPI0014212CAD|nr:serine/threonine-protein kinase [Thalassoroseus pseudoceratinae]
MTQSPGPTPDEAGSPFAFPLLPGATRHTETVINLEGRGDDSSDKPQSSSDVRNEPDLWNRLFPVLNPDGSSISETEPAGPEGVELGHFVVKERIGIGGMGAVFRALDTRLQRVVALKVLGPSQSRDESAVRRFQNEARSAARLDHDNIARVHYFGEDKGLHFIAFEYIRGMNLRDLITRHGPLHPAEAVNYTLQIATALKHTCEAGVVHRDIKPSNIIITSNGRAKLVDLGLARKEAADSLGDITLAGTTLGTFDYISPEQAQDPRSVDIRSDIYSLGCTLYHLLTGSPPYPEGTVLQKLLDHQGKEPPDPANRNRHVPTELSQIVKKMMATKPKNRYATPDDLLVDLGHLARAFGLQAVDPESYVWTIPEVQQERFWERHFGWIATIGLLFAIVIGIERFPKWTAPIASQTDRVASNTTRTEPATGLDGGQVIPPDSRSNAVGTPPIEDEGELTPEETLSSVTSESPFLDVELSESQPSTDSSSDLPKPLMKPDVATSPEFPFEGIEPLLKPTGSNVPSPLRPTETAATPAPKTQQETTDVVAMTPAKTQVSTSLPSKESEKSKTNSPATKVTPVGQLRPYTILRADGSSSETKPTLEAACAAANDGDIIEIRTSGTLPEQIRKPILIKGKKLAIRAAEDSRPWLEYYIDDTDGVTEQTRLIELVDASIDLINIDLRFDTATQLGANTDWAVISLQGSGQVRLDRVSITVENLGNVDCTAIELLEAPVRTGVDMGMKRTGGESRPEFSIEIVDSLIRGGCDVITAHHTNPGRVNLERSAIVVEGAAYASIGNLELLDESARVELRMVHVTAVTNSLIRFDAGTTPRDLLPIDVPTARDNIFATNTSNPLVVVEGAVSSDRYEQLLQWNGQRNFYHGYEMFWSGDAADFVSRDFEMWKRTWTQSTAGREIGAQNGEFEWSGMWDRMESSSVAPADLTLDDQTLGNPAISGATDGTNVGAPLQSLPAPPSFPAEIR